MQAKAASMRRTPLTNQNPGKGASNGPSPRCAQIGKNIYSGIRETGKTNAHRRRERENTMMEHRVLIMSEVNRRHDQWYFTP